MKIFIAKLSTRTTVDDVKRLFERFGTVSSCKVIMDHETKRSKCYGFVEMPNDSEAYRAIVETDDMDFQGSVLQVKKSRPQAEKPAPQRPERQERSYHKPSYQRFPNSEA